MRISVVIAAYNEADTVGEVIARVRATPYEVEVLVVDDGSTDGTWERLSALSDMDGLVLLRHDRNRGKSAALRTAFARVTGEVVIVQDADLEYDPRDYPVLLEPILDGRADVVYGSRFLGGPHRVLYFWHSVGNKFLTLLSNALTNLNLTDMETCYKAFRREVLDGLTIVSDGFGFEPEFTAKVARRELRIYEVPISYSGRSYAEGKKITWKDGVAALLTIVRFRFYR
ncbi:MAG: glycosyltransferase family 2 protein [Candidatus Hydrogenedentes bacterium]|nr:glycosyltransferase family 2 protein [Candidatus Hydrogenedentota bacterium]